MKKQGRNNCTLLSEADPKSSFIQSTDILLSLFNDSQEPQIWFVNVNGTEMARVKRTISLFGLTIDTTAQIAYKKIAHVIQCFGVSAVVRTRHSPLPAHINFLISTTKIVKSGVGKSIPMQVDAKHLLGCAQPGLAISPADDVQF